VTASTSEPRDVGGAKWFGLYPGAVISDEDPDKAGRVQVRVDQIYGAPDEDEKIEDDDLPWAKPMFPVSGVKSGEFHVPPVGATVWIAFWGGNPEQPVWLGGWFTPDDVPDAAKSSYSPGPKTRIVRTQNNHVFEMRWKQDEEEIHLDTAGGQKLRLVDADALDGPKVELTTVGGFKLTLDEKGEKVTLETPGGRSVLLDDDNEKVVVTTPQHMIELDDAGGKVTIEATGDAEVTATANASFVATALAKLAGAQVTVGSDAGAHKKLMDERLIALLNIMIVTFNAHVHIGTPVTSPPLSLQVPVIVDAANTTIAKAD
jgi:uncharacterized protein involved in type VI secretion and phage assembly